MQVLNGVENLPNALMGGIFAIGNFDGIHIGHQHLINLCKAEAAKYNTSSCIITFSPNPSQYFNPHTYKALYTLEDKYNFIKAYNIDYLLILPFTIELASLTAREFIKIYIVNLFGAHTLITGINFKFGKDRKGTHEDLSRFANEYAFNYLPVNSVYKFGNEVSSSSVKHLIQNGLVIKASRLLGKYFSIKGSVQLGLKLASGTLGYPTANLPLSPSQLCPAYGVYLVKVIVGEKNFIGIANIGLKPSLNHGNNPAPSLEVHLFDFKEDLYGKNIQVYFLAFIRPERKFTTLEALKEQIDLDISLAKYLARNLDLLEIAL